MAHLVLHGTWPAGYIDTCRDIPRSTEYNFIFPFFHSQTTRYPIFSQSHFSCLLILLAIVYNMCMAGDFTVFPTALFRFALKCGMFGNIHIFTSLSNMSNISQHRHCTPQRCSVTRDPDVRNWKRTYTAVPTLRNSHTPACLIAKHGSRSATRTRTNASIRSSRSRYWYMFLLLLHRYRCSQALVL